MKRRWCIVLLFVVWCLAGVQVVEGQETEGEVHLGPTDSPLAPVRYGEIEIAGPVLETLPPLYLVKPGVDTTYGLLNRLEKARKDKSLQGVVIKLDRLQAGWGKVGELRRAIQKVRGADKEVVCFLRSGGNLEYYLASAADRIVMPPSASLMLVGLRAEVMFLKNLFEKIGVKGDMVQVGKYKGAAEPFTRASASDAYESAINALLDDMYEHLVDAMSSQRKLSEQDVKAAIDGGPYTARRARQAGLVDKLMFYDETLRDIQEREKGPFRLTKEYGAEQEVKPPLGTGPKELMKMVFGMGREMKQEGFPTGPTIAVLYAVGPIVREDPDQMMIGESVVNAERTVQYIRRLQKRENVRAIVLRIDSPGGSAEASDMIWRALNQANEVKPVIVSMSDVAGSGGYYIATGGRYIFADEGTLTGSIGVVGGKLVLDGLFDKVGITVDVFQRGKNAGIFSSVAQFSEAERERYRALLEETYRIFVQRVSEARKLSSEELERVAQGRPLTGQMAKRGDLVDELGGLNAAIDKARQEAGIPPDTPISVVRIPKAESLLKVLFWGRDPGVTLPRSVMPQLGPVPGDVKPLLRYLSVAQSLFEDEQAAALMPMHITIK